MIFTPFYFLMIYVRLFTLMFLSTKPPDPPKCEERDARTTLKHSHSQVLCHTLLILMRIMGLKLDGIGKRRGKKDIDGREID